MFEFKSIKNEITVKPTKRHNKIENLKFRSPVYI